MPQVSGQVDTNSLEQWFSQNLLLLVVIGAVLVVSEGQIPNTGLIVTIAAITVFLSVYAHGLTAGIGASRYADWFEAKGRPTDFAAAVSEDSS